MDTFVAKYRELFTTHYPNDTVMVAPTWIIHVLPWTAVTLYYLMLCYLPGIMIKIYGKQEKVVVKSKKKGKRSKKVLTLLDYVMFAWNVFLSLVSLAMLTLGGLPFLLDHAIPKGYRHSLCNEDLTLSRAEPATMHFWGVLFVWSKYFELADTVFLIVKKPEREVMFLHWYHHITVLLFTWYCNYVECCIGFWAGIVNAFVHSIMYFYYALTSLGIRPPSIFGRMITTIQMTQMGFGIFFSLSWAYYYFYEYKYLGGDECIIQTDKVEIIILSALVMYGTYLWLFAKFFYKRWIVGPKKGKKKKRGKKTK